MYELSSQPLIENAQIKARVETLADEMAGALRDKGPIMMIGMLRGCFVFMADLARALSKRGVEIGEMDFFVASSYGASTESSGNVKIDKDVKSDIAGRHVLLVDDIIDTGNTLERVLTLLNSRNPASLSTCILLDKPSRREKKVNGDYVGFEIEDKFVVGYGLDFDQKYRELPYIGVIEEID